VRGVSVSVGILTFGLALIPDQKGLEWSQLVAILSFRCHAGVGRQKALDWN
jgi:hypothetical protein